VARRRRRSGIRAFGIDASNAKAGQFLTPTQFRDQFSPTPQDVTAVTSWLKRRLLVGYTPNNRHSSSRRHRRAGVNSIRDDVQRLQLRRRAAALARQGALGPNVVARDRRDCWPR